MSKVFPTLKDFKRGAGLKDSCKLLSIKWCTGGITGGTWGDGGSDNLHELKGDPEPEFVDLEEALLKVAPEISFLLYRKLCRDLITEASSSDGDCYGNRAEYATKSISVEGLYKFLLDHHVILQEI